MATWSPCIGDRSAAYEKELRKTRIVAFEKTKEQAAQFGANAIIGIDLDYETVGGQRSMLMVTTSGTAMTIE
jgi:uncharacterized protein YbjQ (UPF0145 family)